MAHANPSIRGHRDDTPSHKEQEEEKVPPAGKADDTRDAGTKKGASTEKPEHVLLHRDQSQGPNEPLGRRGNKTR